MSSSTSRRPRTSASWEEKPKESQPEHVEYAARPVGQRIPSDDFTHVSDTADSVTEFPNRWARIRSVFVNDSLSPLEIDPQHRPYLREPAAEFLGTMILIIFGTGVDCQVVLSSNPGVASSQKGVSTVVSCQQRVSDTYLAQ